MIYDGPKSGKSLNYLKLTADQRSDVSEMDHANLESEIRYFIENVNSWKRVNYDELWEEGVSVFEEENGLPVIRNERQSKSLKNRIGDTIYLVEGEKVGIGEDGEPLLKITSAKKIEIDNSILESLVIAIFAF